MSLDNGNPNKIHEVRVRNNQPKQQYLPLLGNKSQNKKKSLLSIFNLKTLYLYTHKIRVGRRNKGMD